MKKFGTWAVGCAALCVLLGGCAGKSTANETTAQGNVAEESESMTAQAQVSAAEVVKVTTVTEVFGDGQKPSAAILEYPGEIDEASLEAADFLVEGQTITGVYTNAEAALTESSTPGNYVILEFAYENASGAGGMGGGRGERGGRGMGGGQTEESLSVAVAQTGEVLGTDGTVYFGSETAVESSDRIDLVLQDFELLEYTDPETGCTLPYSIYLPENYDESKEYPLVFFVADASANGDDPTRNLTQGNGAIVWATPEEQAKNECIVVSPQYTNTLIDSIGALVTDDNVWSDGLTLVSNFLHYVIDEYSVDENRIYGTGQSQGCMTNIALSDREPDLFAAQFLVAGQWNVEEMSAMKDKNLWIVVCEGDTKAYPGMNAATENWESLGASVARSDLWDSTSTPEQFDELVKETEAQDCRINYTVFEGGNHTYTWSVAYNIEGIRDWLFAQTKE